MTVRTDTRFDARVVVAPGQAGEFVGTSATDSRVVPLGVPHEPISGAGNQVSSTVPSAATVASPMPAAEVTGLHGTSTNVGARG